MEDFIIAKPAMVMAKEKLNVDIMPDNIEDYPETQEEVDLFMKLKYKPAIEIACEEAIKKANIDYKRGGSYVVMEGPQFSTLAESELYRSWGADVIGMTNMPEAKLAREAEIRYASVSMVTDYDCWHPDHENVDVQKVIEVLTNNASKAKQMIKNLINIFEKHIDQNDPANNCLDVAIITAPEKRTNKTIEKLKTIAGRVLIK